MEKVIYIFAVIFCISLGVAFAWVACFAPEWMYAIIGASGILSVYFLREE